MLTEDYYVFNKLAKGLIGTNNIDTNSRLCMSSAVAGYKQTLGADAPPACYDDIDHAQCIFIAGSNTAWAHPILFRRIEDAKAANPQLKIICLRPAPHRHRRRSPTCTCRSSPAPTSMLFNGMLHIMLWEGWVRHDYIAAHTSGFDDAEGHGARLHARPAWRRSAASPRRTCSRPRSCSPTSPATLSLYCQGLNQSTSGTAKNAALINLHLATGADRQARRRAVLADRPAQRDGRARGRRHGQPAVGAPRPGQSRSTAPRSPRCGACRRCPRSPGKTAVEMFQAAADGEIKALWIACTNPAQSMPDQATVRRALERAEFVVVQEAFATTATCDYADLLLPATTWGEKTGTVTNSERRISRVRPAVRRARRDAPRLGDRGRVRAPAGAQAAPGRSRTLFPYSTPTTAEPKRSGTSTANPRAAATSTSPA